MSPDSVFALAGVLSQNSHEIIQLSPEDDYGLRCCVVAIPNRDIAALHLQIVGTVAHTYQVVDDLGYADAILLSEQEEDAILYRDDAGCRIYFASPRLAGSLHELFV